MGFQAFFFFFFFSFKAFWTIPFFSRLFQGINFLLPWPKKIFLASLSCLFQYLSFYFFYYRLILYSFPMTDLADIKRIWVGQRDRVSCNRQTRQVRKLELVLALCVNIFLNCIVLYMSEFQSSFILYFFIPFLKAVK